MREYSEERLVLVLLAVRVVLYIPDYLAFDPSALRS